MHDKHHIVKELFEQYYTSLVLFSNHYVDDVEISKDLVQDVFAHIAEEKFVLDNVDNTKAYLYVSVRNRSLKYLRHKKIVNKYPLQLTSEELEEKSFALYMIEEELYEILRNEIDQLPEQCSRVLKLAISGDDNQTIADKLGISIETVKSHKQRGKKLLKEKMGGMFALILSLWAI